MIKPNSFREQAPRPADTQDVRRVLGVNGPKVTTPAPNDRVLSWEDSYRQMTRILRWQGPCLGCGVQTWAFDDGENDPRGILGDSAFWGVDIPKRHDDDIDLEARACAMCANTEEKYHEIQRIATRDFTKSLPYAWGLGRQDQS